MRGNFADALPGDLDLIVSNPPYVATQAIPDLAPEVRHEPHAALDGGPDGLSAYRAIVPDELDIIVAALGRPEFVDASMVKPGAIVIDVGITRVPDASKKSGFALKGDVKFDEVAPLCSYITPVPGGVGPMTIAALMKNTFTACEERNGN